METAPPTQLHDSLDLTALRDEIAAIHKRQQTQRQWENYYYVGLALSFFLSFFAPAENMFSSPTLNLGQSVILITVFLYFILRTIFKYQAYRQYIKRLDTHTPAFIPRVKRAESIPVFAQWVAQWVALFVFALGLMVSALLIPALIVVVSLILLRSIAYRRVLAWAYKGGIPRIERLLRFFSNNPFLAGYKAALQIAENRLDDSANAYRDLLARKRHRDLNSIPYWLNNLGVALMYNDQFAEALPYLESAAHIVPTLGNVYDGLAVWYLEQGLDVERALTFGELALELSAPKAESDSPVEKATCARALALTGRETQAEVMIEQAVCGAPDQEVAARAEIHQQIGHARLAQGNREAAVKHFERAVEIDPDGLFGKLSQRALDSLPPLP